MSSREQFCKIIHSDCPQCVSDCLNLFLNVELNRSSKNVTNDGVENNGFYNSAKDGVNLIIKILFPMISIIGCLGNIAIIFIVMRLPWLRKSYTNFFLVNMALADLCVLIWCVNLTAIEYVDAEILWIVGPALCKLNHFIQILSYTASILLLMLMCLERYIAIIFPMKVKEMLSKRIYVILLILIWLISGCFSLPSLFNFELRRSNNITRCENTGKINKRNYHISTFTLLYIVPLALMGSLYGHMSYNLWQSIQPIKFTSNPVMKRLNSSVGVPIDASNPEISMIDNSPNYSNIHIYKKKTCKSKASFERRKVILMLIVIVILFAVCRLPRHVWALMYLHGAYSHMILLIFPPLAYMLMYLSSAINPFVYFAFSTSFRKNFLKALCCQSPDSLTKNEHFHMSNSKGPKSITVSL